jgi:hypothetical protein
MGIFIGVNGLNALEMIGMGQEPLWLLHRVALPVLMGLCLQQRVVWILMGDLCTGQRIGSKALLL